MNLADYGFEPSMLPAGAKGVPARVTAVHKERYALVCEKGELFARLKAGVYYGAGGEEFPTAGDFVLIDYHAAGDSRIIRTLNRKSKFARNDFSGHAAGYVKTVKEQVIAANFDTVFIVSSFNQDFSDKRLLRYTALARRSGAVPVIVLNKADLAGDHAGMIEKAGKIAPGVDVLAVSAKTRFGFDKLGAYLVPGKTVVFLGSSGVGKSSLVNALAGEEIMAVNGIREDDSKGRHTTTKRELVRLHCGAMVIDTPGMRELGMWDASEGLDEAFPDIERLVGQCRFSDCRHRNEPGCAVRAALLLGELSKDRWENYRQLTGEAGFADAKSARNQREKPAKKGKCIKK